MDVFSGSWFLHTFFNRKVRAVTKLKKKSVIMDVYVASIV
jgi:hypothetical protein